MYGLEYALFFGVPDNKLELIKGTSRWVFPFSSRADGEAHFQHWLETFRRWKQVQAATPIRKSANRWHAELGGTRMELFPRPIAIRIPIAGQIFHAFLHTFNRRDYWPAQPEGLEAGYDSSLDEGDIRMNLWSMLREFTSRHGGVHSSRVDIALGGWAAVAPDAFYYCQGRQNIMIGEDYFRAAPDLIAEVLSPPSRWLDRGPRREVYRRAGVQHLWLVEPAQELVEVYDCTDGTNSSGLTVSESHLPSPCFPGSRSALTS
jgi:hypothetical protein